VRVPMNWKWLIKRIALAVATLIVIIIITWALLEYSPNSPANYVEQLISPQNFATNPQIYVTLENYLNTLKPHGNPFFQSMSFLWNVLHGNMGASIIYSVPTTQLIAQYLPWTLLVVLTSNVISFLLGTRFGQKLAYWRGNSKDSFFTLLLAIMRAVPVYIYGAVLLFVLGYVLKVFPVTGGAYIGKPGFNPIFIGSVLYYAFLPILTLTLVNFAGWVLQMRANTINVLGEDFVNYAEVRGLRRSIVEKKYIGRNSILPLYTSLIITIAFSFGGVVFIEQTFSYPGIGSLLVSSISNNDYPVEMGILIIITAAVIVGNLIADLTYSFLDPRVKVGE